MAKFLGCLLLWCMSHASAVTLVDDRGAHVSIDRPPQRIITLLPSLAETVCALGACQRLVGTDNFANWPVSVKTLPKLGGLDDTALEALVRLQPDLVLAARSTRLIGRLESLGIKVLALEPQNQADMQRVMHTVAHAIHVPNPDQTAQALWQQGMDGIAKVKRSLPAGAAGARVYFEASTGGYAAGEASFIGEVMLQLGLRNIVPAHMGAFPQLNPEFVVRAQPQLILLAEPMAVDLHRRPGWSGMEAVVKHRICAFTPAQGDVLVRPGPRLAQAAQLIADCLQRHYAP
jgi:iron complex transport system substrate-binding protein